MEYTVLDENGEASGSLEMVICDDFASLDSVMCFSRLEETASFQNYPAPSFCGFEYFKKQLPISDIYPAAVLRWLDTKHRKQRRGIGRKALRAFRVIAEQHKARLGLLRIGTGVGDDDDCDYEAALEWRKRFYESESWKSFQTPPIKGLVLVWMYHLLPPIQPAERALRGCLVEKPPKDPFFGLPQPIPILETSTPTSGENF
jgi:hypothetical protein